MSISCRFVWVLLLFLCDPASSMNSYDFVDPMATKTKNKVGGSDLGHAKVAKEDDPLAVDHRLCSSEGRQCEQLIFADSPSFVQRLFQLATNQEGDHATAKRTYSVTVAIMESKHSFFGMFCLVAIQERRVARALLSIRRKSRRNLLNQDGHVTIAIKQTRRQTFSNNGCFKFHTARRLFFSLLNAGLSRTRNIVFRFARCEFPLVPRGAQARQQLVKLNKKEQCLSPTAFLQGATEAFNLLLLVGKICATHTEVDICAVAFGHPKQSLQLF